MAYWSAIQDYIGGLVHGSVAGDALAVQRHRSFLTWHLAAGLIGFAAIPFVLIAGLALGGLQMLLFAWPLAPLLAALDLSRTGDLHRAFLLSAGSICLAVLLAAAATDGIASFATLWLAVPVTMAAMSGARATLVAVAAMVAGTAAVLALVVPAGGLGVAAAASLTAALGSVVALAYDSQRLARLGQRQGDEAAAQEMRIAEQVTDLVTRHDAGGLVTAASPAARVLLGVPPEELMGQGLFFRVQVADRPAYLAALSRAAAGAEQGAVEFRLRRAPDGYLDADAAGFRWVEMRCAPLDPAVCRDGRRSAVVAVLRDIGERKAHEEMLVARRAEADRANAAKSRFLATMSHELRTPLNAIIGFAEILSSDGGVPLDEARRLEYAALIHQSGLHLLSVVNGILDMSKIESGSFGLLPEPLAVEPLVASCVKLLDLKAADSGIAIAVEVAPDLPEVIVDPRACRQILLNLLSNAVKFTRPGGRVGVRAEIAGADLVLTVSDTGVGIAAEDLPRLGAPFFQVRSAYDRPYDGTGLGLSVVKGLAELHGGSMEIASRPGLGTRVTIRLPREGARDGRPSREGVVAELRPPRMTEQERMQQRA